MKGAKVTGNYVFIMICNGWLEGDGTAVRCMKNKSLLIEIDF